MDRGNEPLISVCIATYRRPELLRRALASILRQTWGNLEIVVVDDCSGDGTEAVVRSFDQGQIRYYRNQQNMKFGLTICRAVSLAKAELVAILGDDDEWTDPSKLEKQYTLFASDSEDKLSCVFTGYRYAVQSGVLKVVRPEKPKTEREFKIACLAGNPGMCSSTVLLRRSVWAELGGFDVNIRKGLDSEFFRRLVLWYPYTIQFIPDVMVNVHCDSSNRMTPEHNVDGLERAIQSIEYQLQKFATEFALYRSAKAKRYCDLAIRYQKLYRILGEYTLKGKSRTYMWRSILTYPSVQRLFCYYKAALRFWV